MKIHEAWWAPDPNQPLEPYHPQLFPKMHKFVLVEHDGKLILVAASARFSVHLGIIMSFVYELGLCTLDEVQEHFKLPRGSCNDFPQARMKILGGGRTETNKVVNGSERYGPISAQYWDLCTEALSKGVSKES